MSDFDEKPWINGGDDISDFSSGEARGFFSYRDYRVLGKGDKSLSGKWKREGGKRQRRVKGGRKGRDRGSSWEQRGWRMEKGSNPRLSCLESIAAPSRSSSIGYRRSLMCSRSFITFTRTHAAETDAMNQVRDKDKCVITHSHTHSHIYAGDWIPQRHL